MPPQDSPELAKSIVQFPHSAHLWVASSWATEETLPRKLEVALQEQDQACCVAS